MSRAHHISETQDLSLYGEDTELYMECLPHMFLPISILK
jgi:hypothetical protein